MVLGMAITGKPSLCSRSAKLRVSSPPIGITASTPRCSRFFAEWQDFLRTIVVQGLKEDPIGSYVRIIRRIREEEIRQRTPPVPEYGPCSQSFIGLLQHIVDELSKIKLLRIAAPNLPGLKPGDRNIYRAIFKPSIRPYFMYTKLVYTELVYIE